MNLTNLPKFSNSDFDYMQKIGFITARERYGLEKSNDCLNFFDYYSASYHSKFVEFIDYYKNKTSINLYDVFLQVLLSKNKISDTSHIKFLHTALKKSEETTDEEKQKIIFSFLPKLISMSKTQRETSFVILNSYPITTNTFPIILDFVLHWEKNNYPKFNNVEQAKFKKYFNKFPKELTLPYIEKIESLYPSLLTEKYIVEEQYFTYSFSIDTNILASVLHSEQVQVSEFLKQNFKNINLALTEVNCLKDRVNLQNINEPSPYESNSLLKFSYHTSSEDEVEVLKNIIKYLMDENIKAFKTSNKNDRAINSQDYYEKSIAHFLLSSKLQLKNNSIIETSSSSFKAKI